jgi:sulfur-carrier protein
MSTVKLPSVLRPQANGERAVEVEGSTIGDAVQSLVGQHPGLAEQLLTPEGDLHRFVNVYLNGQDVRYLAGLDTPVAERDEIRLLPAIAGGAPATAGGAAVIAPCGA